MNKWNVNLTNNSSATLHFREIIGNGTIDPAPPTSIPPKKNFLCTVTTGTTDKDSVGLAFREDKNGGRVGFDINVGLTMDYTIWSRGDFEFKDKVLNINFTL